MLIPDKIFRNKKNFDDLIQLLLAIQAHGVPDFFDVSGKVSGNIYVTSNNILLLTNFNSEAIAINPLTQNLEPFIALPAHSQTDFLSSYLTYYYKSLTTKDLVILSQYLPYFPPDEAFRYRLIIAKRRLELLLED